MYTACSVPYRTATFHACLLLPFDGRRWFGGNVIAYPVHSLNLIDDLIAYLSQEFIRKMSPIGCHGIGTGNSTQSHRILIRTLIAHHAYASHIREQDGSSLPHLVIESPVP